MSSVLKSIIFRISRIENESLFIIKYKGNFDNNTAYLMTAEYKNLRQDDGISMWTVDKKTVAGDGKGRKKQEKPGRQKTGHKKLSGKWKGGEI